MYRKQTFRRFLAIVVAFVLVAEAASLLRPLPPIYAADLRRQVSTGEAMRVNWPSYGQAAVGAVDYGVLDSTASQEPVPIASVTKIITALTVLDQKPLGPGQQGPSITFTQADWNLYHEYVDKGGAVFPMSVGQKITQYQAMQAMLIASANNIADGLAVWAFGSMDNYVKEANIFVRNMGLTGTTVADASGFSPKTVSTASDLVRLGIAAVEDPLVAGIISKPTAIIPPAGLIRNTNRLLGEDGIVGIKTGNTDEAGSCFLLAAKKKIEGEFVTIVSAVTDAPTNPVARNDAKKIADAAASGFTAVEVFSSGETVAVYKTPWGTTADAVAKQDVSLLVWRGSKITTATLLNPVTADRPAGSEVGSISVAAGQQAANEQLVLGRDLPKPPLLWRILHD